MFKSYFESVYSPAIINTTHIISSKSEINFNECMFTVADMFEALETSSNDYKSGPDLIPEVIYHNCYYTLSRPIHYLFNLSLSTGCYLTKWKKTFIYPVFKSGNKNLIENYRPISRLSALPKILEKILISKMTAIFFNSISDNQHGFRHSKLTLTNLVVYYTDIVSLIGKGIQVDAI